MGVRVFVDWVGSGVLVADRRSPVGVEDGVGDACCRSMVGVGVLVAGRGVLVGRGVAAGGGGVGSAVSVAETG